MTEAAIASAPRTRLLPLREELALFPGPPAIDGSPTWTLQDPVNNRFYRIGWPEFEILSRWNLSEIERIARAVNLETPIEIDADDVIAVGAFLLSHNLVRTTGPEGTARLLRQAKRLRHNVAMWLLKNYLFLRIPLVRPDAFLTRTLPYVQWIYTRGFLIAIVTLALIGVYVIGQQWDSFVDTFNYLFSLEGIFWFAIVVSLIKVVHELGHAYTAKRYGCRVPSMGLAFLVLWPVLYTDVTDSWKLASRSQRLAVSVSGVSAELVFASLATFSWGFLPDGPVRSAAFLVVTWTWIATLLINLSPFMRFDGYFVLSDWLETPNLHARSFALARWWMREKLLGLGLPPPEDFPAGRRRFMIAFAFLTWLYRFTLFMGIAAIVYKFSIRVLGIFLMMVEIGYFIGRPVVSEGMAWWRYRKTLRWNWRTIATAAGAVVIAFLLLAPWRSAVEAPALLKSGRHFAVFMPEEGAQVREINVKNGDNVAAGAVLIRLDSPDIDFQIDQARDELDVLEGQLGIQGFDLELLAQRPVTEREYQRTLARYQALLDEKGKLTVKAPIAGEVVDLAEGLRPGLWYPANARLLAVIDPASIAIDAYVYETDLGRVRPGDKVEFVPEGELEAEVDGTVGRIDRAGVRALPEPYLASKFHGPIPVHETKDEEFIPEQAIYHMTVVPERQTGGTSRVVSGIATIAGRPESLFTRVWRSLTGIVERENGA